MAHGSVHGGGGGGSSFRSSGGGFSSHSSSGGGMSFNGVPMRPRSFHFWGRTVIFTTGKQALFLFLAFFLIIACFLAGIGGANYSDNKDIVENYEYFGRIYEEISNKALAGEPGYYLYTFSDVDFDDYGDFQFTDSQGKTNKLTAYRDYSFEYQGINWCLIEYDFYDGDGNHIKERTYSQYESSTIFGMTQFRVAYKYMDAEEEWYSINAGYRLDNNKEYLFEKENMQSSASIRNVGIVIIVMIVVIIVITLVITIKKGKKDAEIEREKQKVELDKQKVELDKEKAELRKKNRICRYCGSSVPDDATSCPGCGSKDI